MCEANFGRNLRKPIRIIESCAHDRNDLASSDRVWRKVLLTIRTGIQHLIEITERDGAIMFVVRVVPRASRDAIEGEYDGALRIRLTAPALENRANEALRRLLADRLNVPVAAVKIIAGEKSRSKRVAIMGVTREQIAAIYGAPPKVSFESHA